MNIFLLSDLHVEFGQDYDYPSEPFDIVVLAGDIDHSINAVGVAHWFHKQTNLPVILVAGNHEFYRGDFHHVLANMRDAAAQHDHIHFLENDSLVINDVRFLGCTLWSNFSMYGPAKVSQAKAIA